MDAAAYLVLLFNRIWQLNWTILIHGKVEHETDDVFADEKVSEQGQRWGGHQIFQEVEILVGLGPVLRHLPV